MGRSSKDPVLSGGSETNRSTFVMDRDTIFGGSPFAVLIRLALISIVVGVVLSALGINLRNFFDRINELLRD